MTLHNINLARAITWLVGIAIYCTIIWGRRRKRDKKRCRPYTSFFRPEYCIFKYIFVAVPDVKIRFNMRKFSLF